jgi:hypothetical protein
MGEEPPKSNLTPQLSGRKEYDGVWITRENQRNLTPEELQTVSDLVDVSMQLLKGKKIDKQTGFKTAYVMTRKVTGNNWLDRKADPSGSRFYIMLRDLKAGDKYANLTDGLIISFIKTGPNLQPISRRTWSLPRDRSFVEDKNLDVALTSKRQDWEIVRELTEDLKANNKLYKSEMSIEENSYEKVRHELSDKFPPDPNATF